MAKILSFPTLHQNDDQENQAQEWTFSLSSDRDDVSILGKLNIEMESILFEFEQKRDDEVYQRINGLLGNLVASQAEIYRMQDVASLLKNIMDIERQEDS